jgi:hypothetical protein
MHSTETGSARIGVWWCGGSSGSVTLQRAATDASGLPMHKESAMNYQSIRCQASAVTLVTETGRPCQGRAGEAMRETQRD